MVEIRLERDRVEIGAWGDRQAAVVPHPIEAFDAADRTLVGYGPVTVLLPAGMVFDLMLDPARPPTRAEVAAALAGRTPLALRRACWGFAVEADGRVRVAMAHRSVVTALLRALRAQGVSVASVTGGGILLWERTVTAPVPKLWMLAMVPLSIGLVAWQLAAVGEAQVARMQPATIERARAAAMAEAVTARFAQVPASTLLGRIETRLPAGMTLHAIGGTVDGAVELTIDAADPGVLRGALAGDPLLARLRTMGQQAVADRGIRTRLRMERR